MDIFNNAKKLGFGLMRLPRLDPADEGSIDLEQTKQMVDTFLQRGFTYFDTAWMYCAFKSENAVKDVLTSRHPRESYTLATKLHAAYIHSLDDRDAIFNTQREKTGVDYFDYYLLHDMGAERYEIYKKYDCLSWIAEKKRQGLIKHMGFSFHDTAEVLDQILTEHPEMEFVQLQINYLDWDSEGVQSRKCYEVATKHGKPVIVMEPVKGGTLAKLPAAAEKLLRQADPDASVPSWAVRFAAGLPNVKMVLSGMSSTEQLLDNTGFMQDFVPLTQQEQAVIAQVVDTINASSHTLHGLRLLHGRLPHAHCHPQVFFAVQRRFAGTEGQGLYLPGGLLRQPDAEIRQGKRLHRLRSVRERMPAASAHHRKPQARRQAV